MDERANRHNRLESLALRVARLNPDAGEVGAGMLRSLVEEARKLVPYWSADPSEPENLYDRGVRERRERRDETR